MILSTCGTRSPVWAFHGRHDNLGGSDMDNTYLTPAQAAKLKDVSRSSIYKAINEGRIPCERILDRLALRRVDVMSWVPQRAGEPRKGTPMSEEAKRKLSISQKRRWNKKK